MKNKLWITIVCFLVGIFAFVSVAQAVHVRAYTRSDGTYVSAHTRGSPSSGGGGSSTRYRDRNMDIRANINFASCNNDFLKYAIDKIQTMPQHTRKHYIKTTEYILRDVEKEVKFSIEEPKKPSWSERHWINVDDIDLHRKSTIRYTGKALEYRINQIERLNVFLDSLNNKEIIGIVDSFDILLNNMRNYDNEK